MDALRKLGMGAVPRGSRNSTSKKVLSRSISRSSRYGGVIWTTSTQDLATSVLNDISGLQFYYLGHWDKPEEKWPRIRAVVEEWWQVTKTDGEKAWLGQSVRGGGRRASDCVELLVSKYPDDFLEATIAGFVASLDSDDAHPAAVLLKKLAEHRRPQVEAMLIEQMKSAKRNRDCLAMAYVLRKWERREADTVIRARWERMVSHGLPDPKTIRDSLAGSRFGAKDAGPVELLVYLAGSDTSARMVLDVWPTLRSEYRLELVDTLVGPGVESLFPDGPTQRVFLQELLLTALEDTEEYWGSRQDLR